MRAISPLLSTALVVSLGISGARAAPTPVNRLEFERVTTEKAVGDCIIGADECAYVRLEYPVIVDAPDGYAVAAVTDAVKSLLDPEEGPGDPARDVEGLMGALLEGYADYEPAETDGGQPWFPERTVSVVHDTPEIVSLRLVWRAFAGGAHGMTETAFRSLDPRTGRGIGLSDILVDGYEGTLLPLVEARFRKAHGLEAGTSLADAGFIFDNDTFALPDNVGIDGEGLTFYYNLYEVAPYAFGPTEIVLTWDELEELLGDGVRDAVETDTPRTRER